MKFPFSRLAIVNRGEPAQRLIRAVTDLNAEHGVEIHTIALHTAVEDRALFVRQADEAHCLGPAMIEDAAGQRKSSYLDMDRLREALVSTQAEAAWVGWGFVAERPEFVQLCEELGVVFIGPPSGVMRHMGDKIASKLAARHAGVPVTDWSDGPVPSLEVAREHAARLGYPLVIKATAGGGGRGIRAVTSPEELGEAFDSARSEAAMSFGDDTVFIERMVTRARHVEVQIIADNHGTVWSLGVRDCTIQRRKQKIVEESPAPTLSAAEQQRLCDAAARLGKEVGYRNAGTVEFLYDLDRSEFHFMEMNTRLQVEHPVTELTTGVDLVKLQLEVAAGGRLGEPPAPPVGHAMEVRINAEDPDNGFAPCPGRVDFLRLPAGPGVRCDMGVAQGDVVPAEFDSMIGKIICHGRTREEVLARLRRALMEMAIVIHRGTTNKAFLLELLRHADVRSSEVDVEWLERRLDGQRLSQRPQANMALLQVALEIYNQEFSDELAQFLSSVARGRPRTKDHAGILVELGYEGHSYKLKVRFLGPQFYRITLDNRSMDVTVVQVNQYERLIRYDGVQYHITSVPQGGGYLVEVDGVPYRIEMDESGAVRAPAPAIVLSVDVQPGAVVEAGDRLLVLEAMKMEMLVKAPVAGQIQQVLVDSNVQVDAGQPMVLIKAEANPSQEITAPRVTFPRRRPRRPTDQTDYRAVFRHRCREILQELRYLLLGYDLETSSARYLIREYESLRQDIAPDDHEMSGLELQLMEIFTDVIVVSGDQSGQRDDGEPSLTRFHQAFLRYVRQDEPPPESFVDKQQRLLGHYGVTESNDSRGLEEVLFRVHCANLRMEQILGVILTVLEMHSEANLIAVQHPQYKKLLDTLIERTRERFQSVNAVAQQLRFRCFDLPIIEKSRIGQELEVNGLFERLMVESDDEARNSVLRTVINSPQPVLGPVFTWCQKGDRRVRALTLEAYARRFYRGRKLKRFTAVDRSGFTLVHTAYRSQAGGRIKAVAAYGVLEQLVCVFDACQDTLREAVSDGDHVLVDLLIDGGGKREVKALQSRIAADLNSCSVMKSIRRVCVSVTSGTGRSVHHFTYNQKQDELVEETLYRSIHHMQANRLELWRLKNFHVIQIPSRRNVFVFHGMGRENAKDERLFAFVDVRDAAAVRDEAGRIVDLPLLERPYHDALATMREFKYSSRSAHLLNFNRVYIYAWEPIELTDEEVNNLARRLAHPAKYLGLEKVVLCGRLVIGGRRMSNAALHINMQYGSVLHMRTTEPSRSPIRLLTPYSKKVARLRRRGMLHPYEIIRMLTPRAKGTSVLFPLGAFTEYDLNADGEFKPIERSYGENDANVVVGVIDNYTQKHPEGMKRVIILGDPSKEMGALSEPECRRIISSLDLAESLKVPVEWFPVSSGAKISMASGTENLDWTAAVLMRLITFTGGGGEVNLVVNGINVGAQAYWNAEATMLMHTKGILVMTPLAALVLTGKKALDFSGSVSADDNQGIGGLTQIMGPNGQAQYTARDITYACFILLQHYEYSYVAPGERFPRRVKTSDPIDRDIRSHEHICAEGEDFTEVGQIFSEETNAGRKKPFDIRSVIKAVVDKDHAVLERWGQMRDAESAVVMDVFLGGIPCCLIGIESRRISRRGHVPADGPDAWTGGTLFPLASKKVARAINATSGNRPMVVLANLAGFDGSPESMRKLQLEYGAEIGRAVVGFDGPMVFCVISRYHGGAYVVFSRRLNENLEVAAVEGSYASVIGGAPAAAVVFPGLVEARLHSDPRIVAIRSEIEKSTEENKLRLFSKLNRMVHKVRVEKQTEVAAEFDGIHTIQRAKEVGSLHEIIRPDQLRPYLIQAVERGVKKIDPRYQ